MSMFAETNAMSGLTTLRWRKFAFTAGNGTVNPLVWSQAITACTMVGNVATFTTAAANRLFIGDWVNLSGMIPVDFNGRFKVTALDYPNKKFSVVLPGNGAVAVASGAPNGTMLNPTYPAAPTDFTTALLGRLIQAQRAFLRGDAGNAGTVTVGPDLECDERVIAANGIFELPSLTGGKFDLANWYTKGSAANQVLDVLFI